ncbi:unnamed protein product, partial [Polarella glacialis]
ALAEMLSKNTLLKEFGGRLLRVPNTYPLRSAAEIEEWYQKCHLLPVEVYEPPRAVVAAVEAGAEKAPEGVAPEAPAALENALLLELEEHIWERPNIPYIGETRDRYIVVVVFAIVFGVALGTSIFGHTHIAPLVVLTTT